jgi:hypothetical protein
MKIYSDDEIKQMAGHPDCIPLQYIEYFLKGFRTAEKLLDYSFNTEFEILEKNKDNKS